MTNAANPRHVAPPRSIRAMPIELSDTALDARHQLRTIGRRP
jgi:hypothetical protein